MDLLDYIKASREDANKQDCYVRFRIDTDKKGQLFIARNKKYEDIDMGTISLSPIISNDGDSRLYFDGLPHGIATLDDIKPILKGTRVLLSEGESIDDYEPNRVNTPTNRDLGGAVIEYVADDIDDAHNGGDPYKVFVPMLLTDDKLKKNGYAKFLLGQVEKYAATNGYRSVHGVGSPIDIDFECMDKTAEEQMYYQLYMRRYKDKNPTLIKATANLALLYKRLGYTIRPLGSYFLLGKSVDKVDVSSLDRAYLQNDVTSLDYEDIVLGK